MQPKLRFSAIPISLNQIQTVAIVAIFATGSIVGVLNAFVPWEPSTKSLVTLVTLWLATAGLVIASPRPRTLSGGVTGLMLAVFVGMTFFCCLLAQLSGERQDDSDIWRWVSQALAPALLFWGCHAWASTRYRVGPIDIGVFLISLISVSSVLLEAAGLTSYETHGNRYFGFMGDGVAWLISFTAIYFIVRGKYFVALFNIIALLQTQSRGALIVFLSAILLFMIFCPNKIGKNFLIKLGIVAFFIFALSLFQEELSDILDRFLDTNITDNDRTRTIKYTFDIFTMNPLTGSGYDAHHYAYEKSGFSNMASGSELWQTTSSTWVQILADSGLIGFVPFSVYVFLVLRKALRTIRTHASGPEYHALVGLSVWLIAFLLLNHSAAWLLPGSLLSPIVFASAGIVVGSKIWLRRQRSGDKDRTQA